MLTLNPHPEWRRVRHPASYVGICFAKRKDFISQIYPKVTTGKESGGVRSYRRGARIFRTLRVRRAQSAVSN